MFPNCAMLDGLQEHNTVVLPHKTSRKQDVSCLLKLRIIKRFEFTSHAMKSGAVVVPEDAPEGTALLLVKGAPNVVKQMARAGSVPENFDRVWPTSIALSAVCCHMLKSAVLCCAMLCCAVMCCHVLCYAA